MEKERESSIELLRIIAICGVVVLHYNSYGGGFANVLPGTINQAILYGAEGLFCCAVNLFVLITGFFSCTTQKRSTSKAIGLLIQVSIFLAASYLYGAFRSDTFSLKGFLETILPVNYFVVLYVALYLISPYINIILKKLSKRQLMHFAAVLIVLFSVWPTLVDILECFVGPKDGLSTIALEGSGFGYTIVNFVLMYIIGATIRLLDIKIRKGYAFILVVACAMILAFWGSKMTGVVWAYCNPIVILEAMGVFLLFKGISFKSGFINKLSKASFTCFLFHMYMLDFYQIPDAVQKSGLFLVGHIFITCISIYLVSWIVYLIYSLITKPLMKFVDYVCERLKLNYTIDVS